MYLNMFVMWRYVVCQPRITQSASGAQAHHQPIVTSKHHLRDGEDISVGPTCRASQPTETLNDTINTHPLHSKPPVPSPQFHGTEEAANLERQTSHVEVWAMWNSEDHLVSKKELPRKQMAI